MRWTHCFVVLGVTPLICGTDIELQPFTTGPHSSGDERYELATYVSQLEALCDSQIEELASKLSDAEVEKLRANHYSWKLQRDLKCAEAGRSSDAKHAEQECLSNETEEYYMRREQQIEKASSAESDPSIANTPPNKPMKSDVE